ncbi:hypothetical protein [Streptomyces sp. NPDC001340]
MVLPVPFAHAATVDVRCSVRDLVEAINTANGSPGADTLQLARKCTYKLTSPDAANPANGLPAITSEITIDGNGARITRAKSAPAFRILFVAGTGTLTLNKTTIKGGKATDCPGAPVPPFPPGQVCGGGINNQGTLTVNHSQVIDNIATSSVFAEGGGIDNDGTATLYDTDVSGNIAEYTGTEVNGAAGGGIANDGPLTLRYSHVHHNTVTVTPNTGSFALGALGIFAPVTIEHSVISDNRSSARGGVARGALNNASTVTMTDSIIRDNTASAPGGTVNGGAVGNGGDLTMTRSLVVRNHATAPNGGTVTGGAISVGPVGKLTLRDSQVLGNTASASGGTARGGGISNLLGGTVKAEQSSSISKNTAEAPKGGTAQGGGIFHAIGTTTLDDSTVTENRAGDGGGIFKNSGTVTLNNTAVKRNKPNNCAPPNSVPGCTG